MKKNYEIVLEFIKDISSETKNSETYIYVKENINKYSLNIDINSIPLKNKLIEVNTKLTFEDKSESENKSFFTINYATVIKILEDIDNKKVVEKKERKKEPLCMPAPNYLKIGAIQRSSGLRT